MPGEDAECEVHLLCTRIRGQRPAPPGVPRMRACSCWRPPARIGRELSGGRLAPGLAIGLRGMDGARVGVTIPRSNGAEKLRTHTGACADQPERCAADHHGLLLVH